MKTILLIEDNNDIRESAVEILELSGYKVLQAENGKTGVDLATEHKPDLILCDIMMPELDGYMTTRIIRKMKTPQSRIPIIALTADAMKGDKERCLDAGMSNYISKPFKLEEIEAVLKEYVLLV